MVLGVRGCTRRVINVAQTHLLRITGTRLTLPKQLFCLLFAVGLTKLGRPRFGVRSPGKCEVFLLAFGWIFKGGLSCTN